MTPAIPLRKAVLLLVLVFPGAPACSQQRDHADSASAEAHRPAPAGVVFYDVGQRPSAVAAADFTGDGHVDVAVAATGGGAVTLLHGDGTGLLRAGASFAAGREPADVEAADLDRDGDVDLVVANHETSGVTVLLNDGRGRFHPAPGSPFDAGARPHVHGVVAGDFDGDGWVDVAVESADTREVRVLRGGPRGFAAPASVGVGTMPYTRLGAGDVAGDGRPEILVPGHGDSTLRAVEGADGGLRLAVLTIRLAGQPWTVAAGDLDADGRRDLVVVETDAASVWRADGRGFAAAPGSPFAIRGATEAAVGDLDGDRAAEAAIGPWEGDQVTVLAGRSFAPRRVRVCERPIGLAIADLDGDGRGELLAACATTSRLAVVTIAPPR
ncbi:MAG TPA: VCBS repeat-containing protein [Longimicrobium sp.]|nr:VCBS repeat-containing protein [Longimicrobium sp.]